MATKRVLTEKGIAALKATGARYGVADSVVPGFCVRVGKGGKKTYALFKRRPGHAHPGHLTVGTVGALTLADARARAREWLGKISAGIDPVSEAKRQARAEAASQRNSFAAVAEDFIRLKVIGPDPTNPLQRKGREVKRDLEREFISRWAARPITEITSHDIVAVLDAVTARGSRSQCFNLLGHLRRLFNWAIARNVYGITASPCDRMKPKEIIGKKKIRDYVLSDDEIRKLWAASGGLGYPWGPLYRLLLLTGQRRGEVAEASWSEFDLERKLWVIPAERMKMDRAHVVPLSDDVVALLRGLQRFAGGAYLFSFNGGVRPLTSFSQGKKKLDALIGGEVDWIIHDIRRSVRTRLSAIPGISDLVRELVIAHTRPALHRVYDQYQYLDEKRFALDAWAAKLRTIITPASDNNVVTLRAG